MTEEVYEVTVKDRVGDPNLNPAHQNLTVNSSTINIDSTTITTPNTTGDYYYSSPYTYWWSTTSPTYLYQIFCPKPRCKKANWLQLDQLKACTKCGSMLKAVSKKADYEIEVD